MPPPKKRRSRKRDAWSAYSQWLSSFEWTWFATFTTPYELTMKSARRLIERTVDQWRKIDPTCRVFWVAEKFELKDGFHLHALVYAKNGTELFSQFVQTYQAMARGKVVGNSDGKAVRSADRYTDGVVDRHPKPKWCRIELRKFDPKRAASQYLVPYIFKKQETGEYDFLWPVPKKARPRAPWNSGELF